MHPGGGDVRAFRPDAARQLALDPVARFARVAPGDEPQRPAFGAHRPHQRRAEPGHGLVIERVLARLAADAVSTEESVGHKWNGGFTRNLEVSAVLAVSQATT